MPFPFKNSMRLPTQEPKWRLLTLSLDGRLLIYERDSSGAVMSLLPAVRGRGELPTEIQTSCRGFHWFPRVDLLDNSPDPVNPRQGSGRRSLHEPFRRYDGMDLLSVLPDQRTLSPLDELIRREDETAAR